MNDDPTAEVTDLLQRLIRNACVNDGDEASGGENRSVDLLRSHLDGPGIEFETFEPRPGRESLLARIEGTDPSAPTLLLLAHTDVVPVNPDGWSRDPFGGELDDGFVWGRGAVDMLNLTASMAVAFRGLADAGFRPKGTLAYLAVADEEAQGTWGARWLVDHELDHVRADYVITETGGFQVPVRGGGIRLPVFVEERGTFWAKIVTRGTPGHGSRPYRTDNALVKAAEVVRRLDAFRPRAQVGDTWRRYVEGMNFEPSLRDALLDPDLVDSALEQLPLPAARNAHACTHTTFAPTVCHGGTKTNIIPDRVELDVDVRTLPGQTDDEVRELLREALGDLYDVVEVEWVHDPSTVSPIDTPLWDALSRVSARLCVGGALVPTVMSGATDNRFFRRAGSVGYGFGLFSQRLSYEDYGQMFHGNDERIDQDSLRLSTELWTALAHDLLG